MDSSWEEKQLDDLTTDHEVLAGEQIPDPWADDNQTDWPNAEVNDSGGVDADDRSDDVAQ